MDLGSPSSNHILSAKRLALALSLTLSLAFALRSGVIIVLALASASIHAASKTLAALILLCQKAAERLGAFALALALAWRFDCSTKGSMSRVPKHTCTALMHESPGTLSVWLAQDP